MIKVIIFGCNGKMGQVLSQEIALNNQYTVVSGIDKCINRFINDYPVYQSLNDFNGVADVIIDFSHPTYINKILTYALAKKLPLVIATTGYTAEEVELIREASKVIPIFKDANFSYGITVIRSLLPSISTLLKTYDIDIVESHHRTKGDSPSGTALLWANNINKTVAGSYKYIYERARKDSYRGELEIGISSMRAGTIPGEHKVIFAGVDEVIEIKHTAYSKRIFAAGALQGASFIVKKENGQYSMIDLLEEEG